MRRNEPLALRGERFVKFAGYSVDAAESDVAAPFGAVTGNVGDVRRAARVELTSEGSEPSTSEAYCRSGGA